MQDNPRKPASECQTILDVAAATNDGAGGDDVRSSTQSSSHRQLTNAQFFLQPITLFDIVSALNICRLQCTVLWATVNVTCNTGATDMYIKGYLTLFDLDAFLSSNQQCQSTTLTQSSNFQKYQFHKQI